MNHDAREMGDHPLGIEIYRFFDLSPDPLAISAPDGYFKRLNPAWEKTLGYSVDELMAEPVLTYIHPDDVPATLAELEKLIDGRPSITIENRYRCKDGSYRCLEWTSYYYDQNGLIYSVVRDITERKRSEVVLRESETRFRNMADAAPVCIWMTDQSKGAVYFNQTWMTFRGSSNSEPDLKNGWLNGLYPDDVTPTWDIYVGAFDARQTFSLEYRLQRVDGEYRWMLSSGAPRFTAAGDFLGYVGTCVDIHDRKLAETALRQSERILRDLLNGSLDTAFLNDTKGNLIAFNEKFAEQFAVNTTELSNANIYDLLPPELLTLSLSNVKHVQGTRQPLHEEVEYAGQYFDYSVYPIVNEAQEVVSIAIFSRDITERKLTEQKLRQSEEKFRSVLESAAEGILLTDSAGAILLVNRSIEQKFGFTREELLGQSVDILLPHTDSVAHFHHRQHYSFEPTIRPMGIGLEVFGQRKDGSTFPIEVSLSYLHNDGELQVMALVSDITERKQIEQERLEHQRQQLEIHKQQEIIELRQRFMSMVSHEFRTPLTVIASSSEMLQHYYDRLSRERQMEKLQMINSQVRSMVALLDDILALSKSQAGADDFAPEPLDLIALCQRLMDNIRLIDQDQHQIIFDSHDIPPTVNADRRMLEHIITNLLSNAIKYSPIGTPVYFSVSESDSTLLLEIRDQGIGVPPEDQQHLFEPFYRALNAHSVNGTGLGLAIVKQNVERHGGTITFHSIEGQGTTFQIMLPLA